MGVGALIGAVVGAVAGASGVIIAGFTAGTMWNRSGNWVFV